MTDSANFQTQMSEIWKARREREMYRLDLEKEVFMKMQRREKRRDELRSKVKALHDDLVREDITSSQRVKILFSKVDSLKREHQILAAHTERLKLKKRQIELQLVTSYPIIHHAVQQEVNNSHLPVGVSQVSHNVFFQTPQASGPPQPMQYNLQLQKQQQEQPNQPYNATQLGGVGDTVYRGIPGIISTVNSEIDTDMAIFSVREISENHNKANQLKNNDQFDTPINSEDHKNETVHKYLNTLENRICSNSVSSTSDHLAHMPNNIAVAQNFNRSVASNYNFSTQEQVLNQQFTHTPTATQGGTHREDVYNPASSFIQRENTNYEPKLFSEPRSYSHYENNTEVQPQLRSDLEENSNVQGYSERKNSNYNASGYIKEQEFIQDSQIETLERYPIREENEIIISEMYQKPSENIHNISTNQYQSLESSYYQHLPEEDIPDELQQNQRELINGIYNDRDYEHYKIGYNDGNQHGNYKAEDYNSIHNSQNYTENVTDSSSYAYAKGERSQTEVKNEYYQESENIRNQIEENQSIREYKNSSESQNITNQTEENHSIMKCLKKSSENQIDDNEYGNEYNDGSNNLKNDRNICEKTYEEQNYANIENQQVDQESLTSISNNQTKTIKPSTQDESLTSKTKQETYTKQYTEESKNNTSSLTKDRNILDEDSDFFEGAAPVTSSAAYQNLIGMAAPTFGIESDSDEMEGQMAAMALKPKISNTGPNFKAFATTIPSLKPSADNLTDSDSVDSVEAAIQASMNKKSDQGAVGTSDVKISNNEANILGSPFGNPVAEATDQREMGVATHLSTFKTKKKPAATALQFNLSDDESYNVSGGGNDSYDDDDDFFD